MLERFEIAHDSIVDKHGPVETFSSMHDPMPDCVDLIERAYFGGPQRSQPIDDFPNRLLMISYGPRRTIRRRAASFEEARGLMTDPLDETMGQMRILLERAIAGRGRDDAKFERRTAAIENQDLHDVDVSVYAPDASYSAI